MEIKRQMTFAWQADAGQVIVEFPSNMSMQDAGEFEEFLAVIFQGIKRRAQGMEARQGGDEGSVHDSPVHAPETGLENSREP